LVPAGPCLSGRPLDFMTGSARWAGSAGLAAKK
jgi:hypothetical protein